MRNSKRLTALAVDKMAKPGRYGDGHGLWLQVGPTGTKAWLFRYQRHGQARQMGLGPVHTISLAEARQRALDCRKLLQDGTDPIEAKRERMIAAKVASARGITFKTCAERYVAGHEASWKNKVHRAQWKSTLQSYCYPVFGDLHVTAVDTALVLKALEPIWTEKPETAGRVRGRIETVLDWATARGYRHGDNPARWRGHLDKLLPARSKVARVKHHAALPYRDLPTFMAELRAREGVSVRALEFAILTAARTGEILGATWSEIDLEAKVWTVPGERMKAGREHRVPLSERGVAILKDLPREGDSGFVFVGAKAGNPLSNMAMLELMKGMRPGFVPHGLRSSFRDWAAETTAYPSEVVEMALAHTIESKVEAAYRRGDLFEKRRRLMADWATYGEGRAGCADVLPLRAITSASERRV